MPKRSPLALVIELAVKSRDAIARQAATAEKLVIDARTQLDALHRYHGDYLARSARRPEHDTATLRNFNAFIQRLEMAIVQQRTTMEHHETRTAVLKAEYTRAAIKVKSLETLAATRQAEARRAADRAERKLEDEHASRAAHHARTLIAR
ncbi:MAG: flagellar export protein FliJ [Betaproteobacteria bacterium]|nr:flagellar export protein FliJ [Betaproteobacteria bacterium]